MRTKLLKKLGQLDAELDQLIAELETYSHQKLNTKPSANSWSAIQVLHHLVLSEKLSVGYCKKKLSFKPSLKQAGMMAKIRSLGVKLYLESSFKFKAPKALDSSVLPSEGRLDEVIQLWKLQRQEMDVFIQELPEEYLNAEVYKHLFGGRLSIMGMMEFFQAHFNTHHKQIRRAVAGA